MQRSQIGSRSTHRLLFAGICAGLLGGASEARADTRTQWFGCWAGAHLNSLIGAHAPELANQKEKEDFELCDIRYDNQAKGFSPTGTSLGYGMFDDSHIANLLLGVSTTLHFTWFDPASLTTTTNGPTIGSVFYSVNTDPLNPTVFNPLGFSFDAADNFAFDYVIDGFEPLIMATPYDLAGDPIVIPGVGGENQAVGLAVDVNILDSPEPSSVALLCSGFAGLALIRRRRAVPVR